MLWLMPLSLTRFSPNVPLPVPVDTVTFQLALGGPTASVGGDTTMAPPRPPLIAAKLAAVRPLMGVAKVMVQVAVGALRGLPLARLSETTLVLGRAMMVSVSVALLLPGTGSVVALVTVAVLTKVPVAAPDTGHTAV